MKSVSFIYFEYGVVAYIRKKITHRLGLKVSLFLKKYYPRLKNIFFPLEQGLRVLGWENTVLYMFFVFDIGLPWTREV